MGGIIGKKKASPVDTERNRLSMINDLLEGKDPKDNVTPAYVAQAKLKFTWYDADSSKQLSITEARKCVQGMVKEMGLTCSDDDVRAHMAQNDKDNSGSLDEKELLAFYLAFLKNSKAKSEKIIADAEAGQ